MPIDLSNFNNNFSPTTRPQFWPAEVKQYASLFDPAQRNFSTPLPVNEQPYVIPARVIDTAYRTGLKNVYHGDDRALKPAETWLQQQFFVLFDEVLAAGRQEIEPFVTTVSTVGMKDVDQQLTARVRVTIRASALASGVAGRSPALQAGETDAEKMLAQLNMRAAGLVPGTSTYKERPFRVYEFSDNKIFLEDCWQDLATAVKVDFPIRYGYALLGCLGNNDEPILIFKKLDTNTITIGSHELDLAFPNVPIVITKTGYILYQDRQFLFVGHWHNNALQHCFLQFEHPVARFSVTPEGKDLAVILQNKQLYNLPLSPILFERMDLAPAIYSSTLIDIQDINRLVDLIVLSAPLNTTVFLYDYKPYVGKTTELQLRFSVNDRAITYRGQFTQNRFAPGTRLLTVNATQFILYNENRIVLCQLNDSPKQQRMTIQEIAEYRLPQGQTIMHVCACQQGTGIFVVKANNDTELLTAAHLAGLGNAALAQSAHYEQGAATSAQTAAAAAAQKPKDSTDLFA